MSGVPWKGLSWRVEERYLCPRLCHSLHPQLPHRRPLHHHPATACPQLLLSSTTLLSGLLPPR